ncbi:MULTISPECIES: HAAS signaling domain-containing protein [unclassified Nocardiopsis]|uniref:HAAS signaling domain-containing protein n=1 Tax=unclassified Nocardiopsis TaxID=2649073 RepID=UPI0034070467
MTQRSEQLVLDYLSEVGLALHGRVSARERTAYLTGLRARIDERRAAADSDDADTVRRILRGFGSPEHIVQEELTGRAVDLEDDEMIPPKPRHADRPPPPWRGGPSQGIMSLLEGPSQTDLRMDGRVSRKPGVTRNSLMLVRYHPPEAVALVMLVLAGVWWDVAFLWVLGAALVVLSQVWGAWDKWIGVGLPLVACVVGTALWTGEAKFVDQYIQQALPATGVPALGLTSLACVLYLFPKAARSARVADRAARS